MLTEHAPAQEKRPKVGFISLGCPKNLVDSEVMMGLLDRAGAELTPDAETADILVVNTCSFIDKAKQESVDAILEMAKLKTSGSARRLIVAGCLVERYRDEIQKNIPEVDAVVGNGRTGEDSERGGAGCTSSDAGPFVAVHDSLQQRACGSAAGARGSGGDTQRIGRISEFSRGRGSARGAGTVLAGCVGRCGSATAAIFVRPHDAAAADDEERLGVYQDCGRLRSSVQLLRDSEPARQVPFAAV